MSVKQRLSASVDADLIAGAEAAVARGHAESVSAWVNDALRVKLDHDRKLEALGAFVAAYELEHGEITGEEMRDAARRTRSRAVPEQVPLIRTYDSIVYLRGVATSVETPFGRRGRRCNARSGHSGLSG